MNIEKKQHGGRREGAGRPRGDRSIAISVKISVEASEMLNMQKNKAEYIDNLIKKHGKTTSKNDSV